MAFQCFPLEGSAVCNSFKGYSVQSVPGTYTNVTSLDTYMTWWSDKDPYFVKQMNTMYGCPGYTASTGSLRFHTTAFCGYLIFAGVSACGAPTNATVSPICIDTAKAFVSSWQSTMTNASICTQTVTADVAESRQDYLNLFTQLLKGGLKNDDCVLAVSFDTASFCGFPTKDQGQQYCNNNYDQCCTVNGLIQVKSAPLPTTSPNPLPVPASNSPNILIIGLGASGAAVLLIVVVTLICCIVRSKKNNEAIEMQEPPAKYAHNQGRNNTTSSGYSNFSEGKRSFEDRQLQGQYGGGGYMTPEGPTATRRPSGGGSQQGGYGFPNYAAPANGLHGAQNQFNNPYNQPPINHFNHQGQNPYVHQPQNQYMQQSQPMPYNGLAQQPEKRNSQYKNIIPAQHQQAWNTPPMPSGTMALQRQNSISNKTYWVILNFRAENSDEMNLLIGDVVTVAQIYDDGWCFGRKEGAQGAEGVFPFECVAEAPNMKSNTPGKSKFNNRASSLYGSSVEQHLEDGEYRVLYPYIPAMADELQLAVGDKVTVVEEYDDGWAFGTRVGGAGVLGAEGLFPLDLLENYRSKKRVSAGRQQRDSSRHSMYSSLLRPNQQKAGLPAQKQQLQAPKNVPIPTQQQSQTKNNEGKTLIVMYEFAPGQNDEIMLRVGDRVLVKQEYEDGWSFGQNLNTRLEGLFPMDTLDIAVDSSPVAGGRKERASSFYNSQNNSNVTSAQSGGSERVIYEFQPERPDEISLKIGDEVIVNQEFDDGWAVGVNITTGKEGNFPLDCLASYADPNPTTGPKKTKQRVSSIFDVDDAKATQTPAPLLPVNTKKADGSEKVVYSFEPERPDEVVLRVGDVVVVSQAYDDGWGYGKNISTGKEGNFPLDCLASYVDSTPTTGQKQPKQRQSSIFDDGNNADSYYPANTNPVYTTGGNTDAYYHPNAVNTMSLYSTAGNSNERSDTVVDAFQPERSDEIVLRVADTVTIWQEYDDGWCYGKNLSTGKEGNFPLDCLASYKDPKENTATSKQRASSLYGSEYGAEPEKPVPEIAKLGPDQALIAFVPIQPDEVRLEVGDQVNVKKAYDDGWCYGTNTTRRRDGHFPYDCLASYKASHPAKIPSGKNQRVSSIYGADSSYLQQKQQQQPEEVVMAQKAVASPSASVAAPAPAPVKSEEVNVIYAFQPERDDELALRMGDKVLVLHAFDDGWSYGKNLSTGQEGNFPSDCLEATAEPVDTGVKKQRLSSLHGYSTEPNARDVIYDFMPSQSDECLLYADDQVEVLQSYDDGWCYVRNLSSGSEGLCPEDCIDGFNEGGVKVGNVHKSRVSSMYAAGPKNNSAYNAGSNNYY